MSAFLALLAFLAHAGMHPVQVRIPVSGGTTLNAVLVLPAGKLRGPAVVALHGCAGPLPERDGSWAELLVRQGHAVLMPDSFGSRGLGPQCRIRQRTLKASGQRRLDAIAAAEWLSRQPGIPPGGVALLGWSNGGNTVLWTLRQLPDLPRGLFQRFVAFYPGCRTAADTADWQPSGPLLLLVGAKDDWTPAPPCHDLAARFPQLVTLVVYPDAWHDFDAPGRPVQALHGLATPPAGTGTAHTGSDPAARQDAMRRVAEFLDAGTP